MDRNTILLLYTVLEQIAMGKALISIIFISKSWKYIGEKYKNDSNGGKNDLKLKQEGSIS